MTFLFHKMENNLSLILKNLYLQMFFFYNKHVFDLNVNVSMFRSHLQICKIKSKYKEPF